MELMTKINGWSGEYVEAQQEYKPWWQQLEEQKHKRLFLIKRWRPYPPMAWIEADEPEWDWTKQRPYDWRRDGM